MGEKAKMRLGMLVISIYISGMERVLRISTRVSTEY